MRADTVIRFEVQVVAADMYRLEHVRLVAVRYSLVPQF